VRRERILAIGSAMKRADTGIYCTSGPRGFVESLHE
jgi:hypothetical protein